ncbi:sigma factor-like helix-turn-helix DNA-binding protein [Streptomyces sp. NPDC059740]|uniref:sigma factor-like helix-turn-helix DNA-binding protein n=1 Tax=Streptomyces sp. NPDC059740 TaxID=3346926 RepID=UPI003650E437
MGERRRARRQRDVQEFEAFAADVAGRLLHTAALLTGAPAEHPGPAADRLLVAALAHTLSRWDRVRDDDPYDHTRQQLVLRATHAFPRWRPRTTASGSRLPWCAAGLRRKGGAARAVPAPAEAAAPGADGTGPDSEARPPRPAPPPRPRPPRPASPPPGPLHRLSPRERAVAVLLLYEEVPPAQVAARLGLSTDRVHLLVRRSVSRVLDAPPPLPEGGGAGGGRGGAEGGVAAAGRSGTRAGAR